MALSRFNRNKYMNESLKLGKLYSEKCFVECWRKGRNGMCLCFRRNKANTGFPGFGK